MNLVTEYLLATMKPDSMKPSLFDLYIMEQMESGIKPALRHIYTAFVELLQKPALLVHFDQFSISCESIIQLSCITSTRQSSLMESMRSYKRVNIHSESGELDWKQKACSMAYLVLLPQLIKQLRDISDYIKQLREQERIRVARNAANENADSYTNNSGGSTDSTPDIVFINTHSRETHTRNAAKTANIKKGSSSALSESLSTRITAILTYLLHKVKYLLKHTAYIFADVYPYLESIMHSVVIINKLLYTLNVTEYHHPLFGLLGMRLVRDSNISARRSNNINVSENQLNNNKVGSTMNNTITTDSNAITTTVSDIQQQIQSTAQNSNSRNNSMSSLSSATNNNSMLSIQTVILTILLAFKTAHYFTTTDISTHSLTHKLTRPKTVPKCPQSAPPIGNQIAVPNKCAICNKKRVNPCAASSGYVYCYLCLLGAIRDKGYCPMTGIPCKEKDIIRLFESDS